MDIHHAMVVHNQPARLYAALTQPRDLSVWMGAPTQAQPAVGSTIEFHFDGGQRILQMAIISLEDGQLVQWRVTQPVWPMAEATAQIVTWTLRPFHGSTLVDLRMTGWPQDDDTYARVSYKWASFMVRLKVYMGDTREIATFLPQAEKKNTANQ